MVFCLMVVHLGLHFAVMDRDSLQDLEVWLTEAEAWEISAVCGPSIDYSQPSSYLQKGLVAVARLVLRGGHLWIFVGARSSLAMVIALWSGTMVKHATSLFDMTVALSELTESRWDKTTTHYEVNLKNVEILSINYLEVSPGCF